MRTTMKLMIYWALIMGLLIKLEDKPEEPQIEYKPIVEKPKEIINDTFIQYPINPVQPPAYLEEDLEDLVNDLIDSKLD